MGGGTTEPSEGSENIAPQNASTGEGEFVVVERHEVNKTKDDACDDGAAGSTIEPSPSHVPETATFVPGVFHAIGTRLSETSISSRSSMHSTTSNGLVPNTAASPTSIGDNATDEDSPDTAADFAAQRDAAVAAITTAMQAVIEFLYAYAVVVYHEGLALVEQGVDLVKDIQRKWRERGPVRPALRGLVRRKTGLVGLGVGLIVLVLVLCYWKVSSARDRTRSLSAEEWQEKYEAMMTKQAFDSLRNRLKYEKLAGKHMELQAEYEALRDSLQTNDFPPGRSKVDSESCSNDAVNGPVSAVKEALDAAEKSAYDMLKLFSEGLRDDIHDITELKCGERDGICGGSCSSMEEKRGLLFRDAGIAVDEEGGLQEDRSKYKKWGGKGGKKSKKRGKYKLGSTKGQNVKKKVKKGSTKGQNVKIEGEEGSTKGQKVANGGKESTKGGKQQKYMKKNRKYRKKEKKLQSEQEGPKLSKVTQIKEADRIQKYAQPVKSDENHRGKAP